MALEFLEESVAKGSTGTALRQRGRPVPTVKNPLPFLVTLGAGAVAAAILGPRLGSDPGVMTMFGALLGGAVVGSTFRLAAQWERSLIFRLGKFIGTRGPGAFMVIPFVDSIRTVDTRITTIEIPHRSAITKDNVPVRLDGVIFMRVDDPSAAVIRVQNYTQAVLEYAQTALRDIVGGMTLDEILADRELLGEKVQQMVATEIDGWGLDVAAIRIQDIELPEDLKRVMARQASAEREKRATITKAEGDREAASNLADAARTMAAAPGALQLRTLQSLDSLGSSSANTVVLAVPVELTNAIAAVPGLAKALQGEPTPNAQTDANG